MDIVFLVVCVISCLAVALAIGFALDKTKKANKLSDSVIGGISVVLAIAGLFAGFWLADVLKQAIIEQEHTRQYDNCRDQALSDEQCRYFQSTMNN